MRKKEGTHHTRKYIEHDRELNWVIEETLLFFAFNFNSNSHVILISFLLFALFLFLYHRCSPSKSKFVSCPTEEDTNASKPLAFISNEDLYRNLDISSPGAEPLPLWFNSLVLLFLLVTIRLAGYIVLRYIRKPQ